MGMSRLPLLLLTLWACDSPEDPPGARAQLGRSALIVLEHHRGEQGISVQAQAMEWRAESAEAALHALVIPQLAWLLDPEPGCQLLETNAEPWEQIDLLNMGILKISAPQGELKIEGREFSSLDFSISGQLYDSSSGDLPFQPQSFYEISARGGELGAFNSGEIPAPSSLQIRSLSLDEAYLSLDWSGDEEALLLISRDVGSQTLGLRCSGQRRIPRGLLDSLGAGELELNIYHLLRSSLEIPNLDQADLLFLTRDSLHFQTSDLFLKEAEP